MSLYVQMMIGNEEGRYLERVLKSASEYADKILVLDDCSTDKTAEICKSFEKVVYQKSPFGKSMFGEDESVIRNLQWELTRQVAKEGDWIISLDADEEFDHNFVKALPELMKLDYDWISVRLLDMWNDNQYRTDGYWSPMITRLFKFKSEQFGYTGKIHTGCVPYYAAASIKGYGRSDLRLKHLGWIKDEDKKRKFDFYIARATGMNLEHAYSIVRNAQLKDFKEEIELPKVVVGCLVRNREWVLPKFLEGLELLDYPKDKLSFYFIVNDSTDQSHEILKQWAIKNDQTYRLVKVETVNFGNTEHKEHTWEDSRLRNMSFMRNRVLQSMKKEFSSDAVFMIDSDIIVKHKELLKHLICLERPVVSEVFWAIWGHTTAQPLPNVWIRGGYEISQEFLTMLKKPGTYPVGGLGACTVLTSEVLDRGITYDRVFNLPHDMRGEDRDFCVRAACAGIKLWADTQFTPDHVERPDLVLTPEQKAFKAKEEEEKSEAEVKKFQEWRSKLPRYNGISLAIMAKNEGENIARCIKSALPIVDEVVVLDNGSTDNTAEIAASLGAKVIKMDWDIPSKGFSEPRNTCIRACTKPWIIRMDGDEMIPKQHLFDIWKLAQSDGVDAYLFSIRNYQKNPFELGWETDWVLSETLRMFINDPKVYYTRLVHEDIDDALMEIGKTRKVNIVRTPFPLYHFGYLRPKDKLNEKHDWYYKLAEKQSELTPKDPRPYFIRAIHLYHNKQYEEALKLYQKTVECDPKLWGAWNDIGVIKFNSGAFVEAKEAFLKASQNIGNNSHPSHKKKIEENLKSIETAISRAEAAKGVVLV
jgi:glycosyltransferase involved in cell wall biosynthesis